MSSNGNDIAIKLDSVSKCFQIYDKPHHRLLQGLFRGKRQYFKEFWALQDISFEIKKGETVGIIGGNGAGKSTLLQIICGTLAETSGNIEVNGRVAALLELGAGFNLEFTGRENIFMSGSILGLTNEEIENRFDEIVNFADIGDFLEQPVKTYSSGMFVRLAFAVNIVSQPDIMIVDEALAVGDMNFQAKCMTALTRIQDNGATVLFVSHDIGSVKSLCSNAIHLDNGKIINMGKASDVAELYIKMMRDKMNTEHRVENDDSSTVRHKNRSDATENSKIETEVNFKQSAHFDSKVAQFRYGSGGARISFAELIDVNDNPISSIEFNQKVKIRIHFNTELEHQIAPNYYIMDDKKNLIAGGGPRQFGYTVLHALPKHKYIATYVTTLPLQEGNYSIQIQLNQPIILDGSAEFLDVIDDAIVFNVQRRKKGRIWTKVLLPNTFEVIEA